MMVSLPFATVPALLLSYMLDDGESTPSRFETPETGYAINRAYILNGNGQDAKTRWCTWGQSNLPR